MRSRYQSLLVATIVAVLALVLTSGTVKAQLVVESTSIESGAVNVPTVTDISVTFSEALASDYSLSGLEGLVSSLPIDLGLFNASCPLPPAGIFVVPGGCAESVSLSEDGKTVTLHNVPLLPDMPHTLLVLYAQGESGSSLAAPSIVRFSTGTSLPQGGIAGSVSSSGPSPVGTILVAVKAPLDLAATDSTRQLNIAFADQSGNYGIGYVEDGSYFIVGLQIDLSNPDAALQSLYVGTVDDDHNQVADQIDIAGGTMVTGADVSITNQGAKASELNTPALNLVQAEDAAAQLSLAAGVGMNLDGTALSWVYVYASLSSGNAYGAASLGSFVFPPQVLDLGDYASLVAILAGTPVPSDFGDSDGAINGYLNNGGTEFLTEYNAPIGVSVLMSSDLFDFIQLLLQGGDLTGLFSSPVKKVLNQLAAIPNATRIVSKRTGEDWIVAFLSPLDLALYMVAMDDAGNALLVIGSDAARPNEAAATAAATAWEGDAVLVQVSTSGFPLDERGSSPVWEFDYYSASEDSVLNVIATAGQRGGVLLTGVSASSGVPSMSDLPGEWLDSPAALQAAYPRAAAFVATHTGIQAMATLSKGLQDSDPSRAIWRFSLSGANEAGEPEYVNIDIDAVTGVYVSVENDRVQPTAFELGQNYPNPFNPSTSIPYRVAESSHVTLEVFDALGRRVATLVDATMPAGSYEAVWDASQALGTAAPSGVYIYRLTTGSSVMARTMTLMK